MNNITVTDFEEWRQIARKCCVADIPPQDIMWHDHTSEQSLFTHTFIPESVTGELKVAPGFITYAQTISYHANPKRWALLYEALWRLTHGEKHLFALSTDPLVRTLDLMKKAVRRDAHKAKAFIRFKKCQQDGTDVYVAWHEPDHRILHLIGPFFARRYSDMIWSVFTPYESMHWDLETLQFGEGSTKEIVEKDDVMDTLWKDYYRAIFNPARIKIKAMKKEMPVRYWKNLPEASTIASLLNEAPSRVDKMLKHTEGWHKSASDFIPNSDNIDVLRAAAHGCEGCPLYVTGTQTVFGEGLQSAGIMVIGEQPGNEEDRVGRPFMGPAGQLLNKALTAAALNRDDLYLTNAVKHFEFNVVEGRRQNITPNLRKIIDCNAWLQAEINAIKPKVIVTLGVVAGRALFGSAFQLKDAMGTLQMLGGIKVISTVHPSYVLRLQDNAQQQQSFDDLTQALKWAQREFEGI